MDQRSNENSARAARVRRLQIPREFGEPPKIRSFLLYATCRRQQRAFCHPADRLDISQGTRGGFRIDSLLARRREKKPVRPIADGESSFALSLRVVALRNSRGTVIRFVIASLLLAGFIALSSVEASAVVSSALAACTGLAASRPAALWSSDVLSSHHELLSHHERPLCAAGCIDHLEARLAVGRGFGATSMISTKLPLWLTAWRARFTFFNG
jgi:hypothetical protein